MHNPNDGKRFVMAEVGDQMWVVMDTAGAALGRFTVKRLDHFQMLVDDHDCRQETLVTYGPRGYSCWCRVAGWGFGCAHRLAVHIVLQNLGEAEYPWLS